VTPFEFLKLIHVSCAFLSISGFALRGYWMLSGHAYLQHRLAKVLPHIIDTLLLGSAVGMLLVWRISPLEASWISAKIIALLLYIGLGMVALRFGKTRQARLSALLLALLTAGYIVSVAYSKNALGFFQWLSV
jgi:uncharacterized membrane protein SirB2